MKKIVVFFVGISLSNASVYSQINLDSVISKYLVETRQINKAINTTVELKRGKLLKNVNYFFIKKPIIRLSNSSFIQPVVFGCYKSHSTKYLLIQLNSSSNSTFYFYGNNKLLYEIEKLKNEVLENITPSLKDEESATLINYLSLCYL
jgi:hypothetical protein